jgi:hypothetical protein
MVTTEPSSGTVSYRRTGPHRAGGDATGAQGPQHPMVRLERPFAAKARALISLEAS